MIASFARWFSIAFLLAWALPLRTPAAEAPDEWFIRIYRAIQEADNLKQTGRSDQALAKFLAAEEALKQLHTTHPTWNEKIIRFRLNYIAERTGPLRALVNSHSSGAAAPTASSAPVTAQPAVSIAPTAAPPALSAQTGAELRALRDQVRQLEADRALLNAKLAEALTAQPAGVDPREHEKAQKAIRDLEKEKSLLQATLDKEKASNTTKSDATALTESRKALEEASRRLTEQDRTIAELRRKPNVAPRDQAELAKARERSQILAAENDLLKKQVATLEKRGSSPNAELEALRRELAEAKTTLAAQKAEREQLLEENQRLARNLESAQNTARTAESNRKKLERDFAEAQAKLAENLSSGRGNTNQLGFFGRQRLKRLERELARLETELNSANEAAKTNQAMVAALQTEKARLDRQVQSAAAAAATATAPRQDETQRIQRLEKERDELKKQLKEASKKNSARNRQEPAPAAPSKEAELRREVESLKARVEVFEAAKEPYSRDEIALFRRPIGPTPPASRSNERETPETPAPSPKRRSLPPDALPLVAEAQRAFSARNYAEAEAKYRQILKMDDRNVFTLSNLAAILAEQNRLDEAEKHLKTALESDPRDPFSLSWFGRVKFQQEKFDEALDALSLAVQVDGKNPETQNYLGITLSQKGQRRAAEAALRRAVQLSPNYASAHHNLAIIYATQTPPFTELARWHYDRALSAGHARNNELEVRLQTGSANTAAR